MMVVIVGRVITTRGLGSEEFAGGVEKSGEDGLGYAFEGEKESLHDLRGFFMRNMDFRRKIKF